MSHRRRHTASAFQLGHTVLEFRVPSASHRCMIIIEPITPKWANVARRQKNTFLHELRLAHVELRNYRPTANTSSPLATSPLCLISAGRRARSWTRR
jgi:hypothetical protein